MKKRRYLSTLLTLLLLLTTATGSLASPYLDIDQSPHREAIIEMSRLGILQGVGNNLFSPQGELNRAAAAKVAAILLGYTEEDAQDAAMWDPIFSDVEGTSHQWALGWINLMADEGVLLGVGENSYAPGSPLQMVHWVTILSRILQHEEEGMAWPDDYNALAESLGLDEGLDYTGSKVMNRGQMAQMTTKSIYEVPRPDGMHIIDLVEFEIVDLEDLDLEEIIYQGTRVSVSISQSLVPAGGGQTVTVTARATYGPANLPAAGTIIHFMANAGELNRNDRFSPEMAVADTNGLATATYTTHEADDDKSLNIKAGIRDGDDWTDGGNYLMASNNGVLVQGKLINPFNGAPIEGASLFFDSMDSQQNFPFNGFTGPDGMYSVAITPGRYYANIDLNPGTANPHDGPYKGSHSEVTSDGTLFLRQQFIVNQAGSYSLDTERGIMTGMTSNFSTGTNLYFTLRGTNNTSIAEVSSNGRFLLALSPGNYEVTAFGGTIYRQSVTVEKGKITDIGTISR